MSNAFTALRSAWQSSGPHGDAHALKAHGGWGVISLQSAVAVGLVHPHTKDPMPGYEDHVRVYNHAGQWMVQVLPK